MDPFDTLLRSQDVFRRPLMDFVRLHASSPSLQDCVVLNMDRYRRRRTYGLSHRFLLLQLRTQDLRTFYIRMERLFPLNTSLTKSIFSKPLPARDEVMVARHYALLLNNGGDSLESSLTFHQGALNTCRLVELLQAVHEECDVYRIYPDNCWYFCSVIEENLLPFGEYVKGDIRYVHLSPESRTRVRSRFHALPRGNSIDSLIHSSLAAEPDGNDEDIATVTADIETLYPSIRSDVLTRGYLLLQDIVPDTPQTATGQPPKNVDKSKPKSSLETLCAIVDFLSIIDPNPRSRHKLVSHTGEHAQTIMHCLQAILDAQSQIDLHPRRPVVIRMLQDICKAAASLPASYYLHGITSNSRLSSGGEAFTYRGTLEGNSRLREVVLRKVFLASGDTQSPADETSILQSIRREIITHRQLTHENIIPLLGIYRADDHPLVIITPWRRNGHALGYLEKSGTQAAYLRIILGISMALEYLHSREPPVIHGDLHGRNVLVNDDGLAQLCDFGFTRLKYETTPKSIADGSQMGCLRYLAPELFTESSRRRTAQTTDMYSCSMTILQLGTLSEPFSDKYEYAWAAASAAQRKERPEMPSNLAGLSDVTTRALWGMLESMWAHNPAERMSAADLASLLRQFGSLDP